MLAPAWAQATQRVSLDSHGGQANSDSDSAATSADGRYVAFWSSASNLVPGDTNAAADIFVRDRQLGTTERASVDSGGAQANSGSDYLLSISADGRYVAFASNASNLVPGDTNGHWDVFVRDRQLGTTERVSVDSGGAQANADSLEPSISADGRYVAFWSNASNLVPGDTNTASDIFVRDRLLGTTERVSVDSNGTQADKFSDSPSISADGRYVAFESFATNLVPGDTNGTYDVFVHDRQLGTTERVSVDSNGAQANSSSGPTSSISADGRYVAFASAASNLVPGDTNDASDVFVRDRLLGTTERDSVDSAGAQGNGPYGSGSPSVSADGRYVVFASESTNLVPGDTNGTNDIFVRDRLLGTTERVSVDSAGAQANSDSSYPSISADGRYVGFTSNASNLVPGDTNAFADMFVRDRLGDPSFTSLCTAGMGGVIACPCSNPPSAPGQGCNNSANTGGASLSGSGNTYLSSDSLVFTASAEAPSATSIVIEGNSSASNGLVFGQGVRCVGGTLKRLYTKTAIGGSITAPQGGDLSVSARSAALGDVIQAGESRWYLVYYRDPIVLGGCPSTSTFNSTQTARIDWWW
jgi:Tol biopolymer transport system component